MAFFIKLFGGLLLIAFLESAIEQYFKSTSRRGRVFEKEIVNTLKIMKNGNVYGRVLRNIYLPKNEDETSEIDVLYITTVGLFVIECKNYKGWIFGKETDFQWKYTLPAGRGGSKKYYFPNPLRQNQGHIKPLQTFLNKHFPDRSINAYPVVVFSHKATLKDVPQYSVQPVVQVKGLTDYIRTISQKSNPVLTQAQVDELYEDLRTSAKATKEIKRQHIANIRSKYSGAKFSDGDKVERWFNRSRWYFMLGCLAAALVALVVLYIYPKHFKKYKSVTDERTGKTFEVVDKKVQVYLPVEMTCDSSDKNESFSVKAKYDNNARLIEKDVQYDIESEDNISESFFYAYDPDGNLTHITENNKADNTTYIWNVSYLIDSHMAFKRNDKKDIENGENYLPYYYVEYTRNGMFAKEQSSSEGFFAETNQAVYYMHSMNGNLDSLSSETKEETVKEGFTYNDEKLSSTTLEGTRGDYFWNESSTFSYNDEHLSSIKIFYNDASKGVSEEDEIIYTLTDGKLSDVNYSDEISNIKDPSVDKINALMHINYSNDDIQSIACDLDGADDINIDLSYDNGEISTVSKSWSGSSNRKDTVNIKYQLYEIDLENWENYIDNYYIYRYEMLNDCLDYGAPVDCFNILQIEDGYYENYILYNQCDNGNSFDKTGFAWAAIPSILDGDFDR